MSPLPSFRGPTSRGATSSAGAAAAWRRSSVTWAAALLTVAAIAIATAAPAAEPRAAGHWVGTWSASPQAAWYPLAIDGQTVRQVVHASIGGTRVRVRLSNAYGAETLRIGAARVGLAATGAAIVAGSDRILTFAGAPTISIAPGALVLSDPVDLRLSDRGRVAVSLYLPGQAVAATEHALGLQTTYLSPPGDFTGADVLPTATTTQSYIFLTGLEVDAPASARAIVTLGDSITDGLHSTADMNRRWPDRLRVRLRAHPGGARIAVLNAGISGNRILHDMVGTSALARLDRDVLVQPGARWLVVLLGINDIGFPGAATADEIIAGHRQIIARARAMGLKVYGGTIMPFQAFLPGLYYTPEGEATRQAVNRWIRTGHAYDAVIDFDRAMRDPGNPLALRPSYDSGDNLHPNDAGYEAMARAVDLALFAARGLARPPAVSSPAAQSTPKPVAALCPCAP